MGKYNSINDAIRQKIDDLVESNSLDQSKYLYTPDVVSSLNQLTRAFGGNPESTTIADALYESLDSAGAGSSGGESGDIMSQVNWVKVVDNEEVTFNKRHEAIKQVQGLISAEQLLSFPFHFIKALAGEKEIIGYTMCTNNSIEPGDNASVKTIVYSKWYIDIAYAPPYGEFNVEVTNGLTLQEGEASLSMTELRLSDLRTEGGYQEGDTATVSIWLGTLIDLPEWLFDNTNPDAIN